MSQVSYVVTISEATGTTEEWPWTRTRVAQAMALWDVFKAIGIGIHFSMSMNEANDE
jgi:hypothetical protein